MSVLVLAWILALSIFTIQDGAASIWYYETTPGKKETWARNHSWRLARIVVALIIVILVSSELASR